MKICLLGKFSGNSDEGMQTVSNSINQRLSLKHDIVSLNPKELFKKDNIFNIRRYRPNIIHYLHGPTIRSLIILRVAKYLFGYDVKTIVSATRPYFSRYSLWAVSFLKPDLILTQSDRFENFFRAIGCPVQFLPNGVDCERFKPASKTEKLDIRKRLGLPSDKRIVLHVGHIKANRNLGVFKKLQRAENIQVVIVGSTAENSDEALKKELKKARIKIFHEYFNEISVFYRMADLYVFPTKDTGNKLPSSYRQIGAIDMPLSVLEAMSCNLPVISTEFGVLPKIFRPGEGLNFYHVEEEILPAIRKYSNGNVVKTRAQVQPYDWMCVIEQLERIYKSMMTNA
jgi:glycosyltransferase involved in cell wall biosynthesis